MSLRVWLPLNGDLHNQGLSDVTVTNNGATVDNNGKIGKCYYFNGSSAYMPTSYSTAIGTSDFSIAMWIKIPTLTSGTYYAICTSKTTAAASSGFGIYWNYSQKKFLWSTADGSNATEIWMANAVDNIVYDKWIHLVMIRNNNDPKKGYFYINGVRYELASIPVIRNITTNTQLYLGRCTGGSYLAKMYLNDFRIYDHALSELEIKEIARAKVLHYPLNNNGLGNPNLIANSKQGDSWGYPSSSYNDRYAPITLVVPDKDVYTLSFEAKSTVNGDKMRTHYYSPNTTTTCISSQGVTKTAIDGHMDFTLTTTWTKYWVTYYQSATTAVKHLICPRLLAGQGTGTVSVRNVKFEEGSVATPWVPATSDAIYPQFIGDTNIIYDLSGYCNNGTIVNSLTTVVSSPKFNCATHFNGSAYIYTTSPCAEVKTLSLWAKWDTIPSGQSVVFLDAKSHIGLGLMSTGILCITSGLGSGNTFSKTSLVANTWYHFVVVNPGGTTDIPRKLYINGIEQTATSNTSNWTYSIDQTQIGKRSTTSDGFVGSLSDVRMYAAALSAEDVLDLYNNSNS